MFDAVMQSSMMRIAQEKGILEFVSHDLRDWTHDRHRTTDDDPYGGGSGLVMKCEPIYEALDDLALANQQVPKPYCVFMSPAGRPFSDQAASNLALKPRLLFVCGHYEGIDERAYDLADEVISIGDYVLTSGELASMVVIDAVVRKLEGVLGDATSALDESFCASLLEYPHFTRPSVYRGKEVPEVLLSGNHAAIALWRRKQSLERTLRLRPDLIDKARSQGSLDKDDWDFLDSLSKVPISGDEALS
jgi:tRNA (guanine37-N1)-methyltransferase